MDLLALEEVKTVNCRDLGGSYLIDAEVTTAHWNCPKCDGDNLYDHASREVDYTDTPLHGMPCLIRLKKKRQRCKDCRHVCACAPNQHFDEDFRMTVRCAQWIERQAIYRTFTDIAEDLGIDEKVVRGVFARYSEAHIKELEIKAGRWLGIDELHLLGKHRCILTNIADRTVIDLLKDRYLDTVTPYLKNLKDNHLIEHACIDMWDQYRIAINEALPKVDIVTDKFHLLKETNKCMKAIRLHYQRNMKGYAQDVFRNRFLFDRRAASHTDKDKEKLEVWRAICPDLVDAYWTKEKFFQIYDCQTKEEAKKAYQAWVDELPLFVHRAFKPLMNTISNWETEIFNYFDRRITNNYTECMNGIAKIANRKGRGYSFKVIRFKLLFGYNATRVHVGSTRAILTLAKKMGIEISTSGEVLIPEQG